MEEWRDVVGYEGIYEVSSLGRIRRIYLNRGQSGNCLKLTGRPYLRANLSQNNEVERVSVHQVVAEAFLGPCPPGKQVNHKDGVKKNNPAANLEYLTPKENISHALKHGLRRLRSAAKLTPNQVKQIRELLRYVQQKDIAERFNMGTSAINAIAKYRSWKDIHA